MGPANPAQFFGVAEGVINLKAQYGYDADGDKQITDAEWTKSAARGLDQGPRDPGGLARARPRLRGAAGFRSPKRPLSSAPHRPTSTERQTFVMTNVDGTPDSDVRPSPNNWRYYRYRVYEKVIPLRNMIWGQSMIERRARARRAPRNAQGGIVLFVALIVLVIMALTGLAMIRQSSSGLSIAGNLGMRQNALVGRRSRDRGGDELVAALGRQARR